VLDYSATPARVDQQLAAAAVAQVALLGALAYQVGLGPVGWLAGVAYALGLAILLGGAARRAGSTALGPADVVTLARASLAGGVTALVMDRLGGNGYPVATLVLLSSVALALDGVDGWVARRTRTVSALGARFDMEDVLAFADALDAPVVTTFKAKGLVSDRHPLGAGVLGRSGTPVASWLMKLPFSDT